MMFMQIGHCRSRLSVSIASAVTSSDCSIGCVHVEAYGARTEERGRLEGDGMVSAAATHGTDGGGGGRRGGARRRG